MAHHSDLHRSATEVSTNVSHLMKNIVQMPMKIIDPNKPEQEQKGEE